MTTAQALRSRLTDMRSDASALRLSEPAIASAIEQDAAAIKGAADALDAKDQRISELKFALGDAAGWFDRHMSAKQQLDAKDRQIAALTRTHARRREETRMITAGEYRLTRNRMRAWLATETR